ncbi:MAG: GTPase HflX [Actinomycetes bacterium]
MTEFIDPNFQSFGNQPEQTTGELDLEARSGLRRVAGLSTELQDVTEVEYRQLRLEKVVLIGVWSDGDFDETQRSLAELAQLAETAGSQVLDVLVQRRDRPDPATFIGSGKLQELHQIVMSTGADTVICNGELSPSQLSKMEKVVKVKVIDRTWLILDIFAQHARSREGKAQVSLAQMQYMLPRLRGWGDALSRQSGGIGTRGPGETKLESDRRRIGKTMAKLRREIKDMSKARETQRAARRRSQVPAVAIAGYTNAGKSSLLNRLTSAGVLVENALFATLDPTVRQAKTPSGREFTISDTVGFVRDLPHQLVEAFRSTLEEVSASDLIVHVVDGSDPDPEGQLSAVRKVLADIDAGSIPELVVINKADAADPHVIDRIKLREKNSIAVSALTGQGLDELIIMIEAQLPQALQDIKATIPYERGELLARAYREGRVLSRTDTETGTVIIAKVPKPLANVLEEFSG